MIVHYHEALPNPSRFPGVQRMISMDRPLGAAAITQGLVTMQPGSESRPHTHPVEESMMLLQGHVRVYIAGEVVEIDRPATILAPANTIHAIRNVGTEVALFCIAYAGVNVETVFVEGVMY